MNEILRDMINEGKVVVFVDDVLVRIETEKGQNEIIEEVLCNKTAGKLGDLQQ